MSMGHQASLNAFEMAGIETKEIELIIIATIAPDTHCPLAANWLQAKLGADQAVSFDVTAASRKKIWSAFRFSVADSPGEVL